MNAIGFQHPLPIDDARSLIDLVVDEPVLRPRDVLVRVEAVSVNPVDVKVRSSATPEPGSPRILGWDAAGVVVAVGDGVTLFKPGDEVWYAGDLTRSGSNAQRQAVDERVVARKPTTLDFEQAAALPLTAITAWELLFDRLGVPYGRKQSGRSLLIINGAGGVGSILIQLARRLTGLTVIATASRPETIAWCRQQGADWVIDHRRPLDEALAEIGIPAVDYVASLTGTEAHLPAIVRALKAQGKLALIDDPKQLDIVGLKRKSITVAWELMFTRSLYDTPDLIEQHALLGEVAALVDAGVLRTTMNERLGPMTAATLQRAHAVLESGKAIGKMVLGAIP